MAKELYKIEIGGGIENVDISKGLSLSLGGRTIKIEDYHNQDCCESVYADWDVIKDYLPSIKGKRFNSLTIKEVEGMGFLLCFEGGYHNTNVFVPCYNYQNGYYGDDLALNISDGNTTTKIDISPLVEHHID
jgi:hypothetical protein